jgi:hypothetical protein
MFHRLVDATYFGGPLLPGVDKLNDPVGGGSGTGVATPVDSAAKTGGTYDGVYFVAGGEQANAFNTNRGMQALGENTDELDDLMHRDIAASTRDDVSSGHGGSSTHAIDGSVDNTHVGSPTLGVVPFTQLFSVTDDNDAPIFVNNNKVVVTGIAPDNRGAGDGFDSANPLTLTFNETIPDPQAFRVYYGFRRNLATLPEDAFTFMDIIRATEPGGAASGTSVNDALWSLEVLSNIESRRGGLGQPETDLQGALDNANARLEGLRAFSATVCDGSTSFGADLTTTNADALIDNGVSSTKGGLYLLKDGTYSVPNTGSVWDVPTRMWGVAATNVVTPKIVIDVARASNLVVTTDVWLSGVSLESDSTSARFEISGDFTWISDSKDAHIEAGSLFINTGTGEHVNFRSLNIFPNSSLTGNFGVEVTGTGTGEFYDCGFDDIPSTAAAPFASFYMHDMTADTVSKYVFEGCAFISTISGADACHLLNVRVPVVFRNCRFAALSGSADAWAINLINCTQIVFENCLFEGFEGQGIKNTNSGATFRDCRVEGGTGTALANPQLIAGDGYVAGTIRRPFVIEDCSATFDAGNVCDGANTGKTTAPTLSIFEFGGEGGAVGDGRVRVDGLILEAAGTMVGVHNAASLLMHSGVGTSFDKNKYKNIVFDQGNNLPDGVGTLDSVLGSPVGCLVAAGDSGGGGDMCCIENLSVVNVASPDVAHVRGVLFFSKCIVNGLTLDATTTGTSTYNEAILSTVGSELTDVRMFPTESVGCAASTGYVVLQANSVLSKMRYVHQGGSTGCAILDIRAFSSVYDSFFHVDVNLTDFFIDVNSSFGKIHNSHFHLEGTSSVPMLSVAAVATFHMTDSTMIWNTAGTSIAAINSDLMVVTGNRFLSTNASAPTVGTFLGTGRFPTNFTDENILAGSAPVDNPFLF